MTPSLRSALRTSIRTCAALACCAVALAACGGGGGEDDDRNDGPKQRVVEERDLDLGSAVAVATKVPETTEDDLANGRAVEATRIGEIVVDPVTVDARFQRGGLPSGAMASPRQLTGLFADVDPKLFAKRVSGASSRRSDSQEGGTSVTNAVITFDTAADAAAFVKQVGDKNEKNDINQFTGEPTYGRKITIPGHPKVRAATFEVRKNDAEPSITALTNQGRAVAYVFASGATRAELPELQAFLGKLFTAQIEAMEDFEPARLTGLLEREVDRTGVAKLTVRSSSPITGRHEPDIPMVWRRNGALHMQSWVGGLDEAFERADVDALAQSGSNVYRAGDAKQAERLLDDFDEAVTKVQYREFHTPKGLREAKCYKLQVESSVLAPHVCMVQYGRYIGEVGASDNEAAEGLISAQYLVFQEALGERRD